jgi:hypothetical protein
MRTNLSLNTRNILSMKQIFLLILISLVALIRPAAAEFYSQPWTDDASAGVDTKNIVWAYNFGTKENPSINEVNFQSIAGATPSVANRFVVLGTKYSFPDTNSLTSGSGGSKILASEFIWGGQPATITLSGLEAGKLYSLHVYSTGAEGGVRECTWISDGESAKFDQSRLGDNNGLRITYSFSPNNSTKTITIQPKTTNTWHLCGIALTRGPTHQQIIPTISAAAASADATSRITGGNEESFRFNSTDAPFIEFDFIASRTVDAFINVTEKNTTNNSRLSESRIIFDTDGRDGFDAATDTVVNFDASNTGHSGMGYINRFTPVTAQKARWEALNFIGSSTAGTMEMAFLQSPTRSVMLPHMTRSSLTIPFSPQYNDSYAGDRIAGWGDIVRLEYASALEADVKGMGVEFNFSEEISVSGFDYFDRITSIYQTPSFSVEFLDREGQSIPGTVKTITKSSWLSSSHFEPITCKAMRLTATKGSSGGYPGVGEFVVYKYDPKVDVTFQPVLDTLIGFDSATVGGNVNTTGVAPITQRGVVFAMTADNANPQIGGLGVSKVIVSGSTGIFSANLNFLLGNTSYTYRTFATDSGGVAFSYSAAQTFTTTSPPPSTFRDANVAHNVGLWIGEVELNEVVSNAENPRSKDTLSTNPESENSRAWRSTPAAFRYTIIMHVDSQGNARLLPEATLMQTDTTPPRQVIVTQPELLGDFTGITLRGGKLVGQRFSASNFPPPFEGTLLTYDGKKWITGSVHLNANAALNPFLHKYHRELSTGLTLTRNFIIDANLNDSRSDNLWTSVIYDTVDGIHKNRIRSRGIVTFTRVSNAVRLNHP